MNTDMKPGAVVRYQYTPASIETGKITLYQRETGLAYILPDKVHLVPGYRTVNDVLEVVGFKAVG